MGWRSWDAETHKLIAISTDFLQQYFRHDALDAETAMTRFLDRHGEQLGEDGVHHYGAYVVAGLAHFVVAQGGSLGDAPRWLMENGHWKTPREALEYARKTYFDA